jgi:hypothetical protein
MAASIRRRISYQAVGALQRSIPPAVAQLKPSLLQQECLETFPEGTAVGRPARSAETGRR